MKPVRRFRDLFECFLWSKYYFCNLVIAGISAQIQIIQYKQEYLFKHLKFIVYVNVHNLQMYVVVRLSFICVCII